MEFKTTAIVPPISVKFRDEVDMTVFEALLKMNRQTVYVATALVVDEEGTEHFSLKGYESLFACALFDWRNDLPIN